MLHLMVGLTSLPLTNMRDRSGWVECIVLRRLAKDFFVKVVDRIKKGKKM